MISLILHLDKSMLLIPKNSPGINNVQYLTSWLDVVPIAMISPEELIAQLTNIQCN